MRKKAMGANDRDESKWPKCLYWITKCSRFCSGERVAGGKYCINHIHMDPSYVPTDHALQRKRVVCPVDPSHTVFEDKLAKHIKICNKSKRNELNQQCPYYCENFNSGDNGPCETLSFASSEAVAMSSLLDHRSVSSKNRWRRKSVQCTIGCFRRTFRCVSCAPLPSTPLLRRRRSEARRRSRCDTSISR